MLLQSLLRYYMVRNWIRLIFLFQVFCPIGMIQSIITTTGWIYLCQGRTDIQLKWHIFSTVIIVLAFVIGLKWDVEGVAIAYGIANFVLVVPCFYISFRLIGLKLGQFFRNFILTGIASLVMMLIVFICRYFLKYTLNSNDIVVLFISTTVGVVSYAAFLWIFGKSLLREIINLIIQARSQK